MRVRIRPHGESRSDLAPRTPSKWRSTGPAVIGTALMLVATGCGGGGDSSEQAEEVELSGGPERVKISEEALRELEFTYARVAYADLTPTYEAPGALMADPDRLALIGSRVSGRVVEVTVNVGDEVTRGMALVVIESIDIGRAVADYASATARADVARRAAERTERLFEERIASERRLEEDRGEHQATEADLRAAEARLRSFGVPIPPPPESELGRVTLTSPIRGAVVERTANVGQWVEPVAELLEVVDVDELWLTAAIYEREIRHIVEGQPVLVDVRAYPGEVFEGVVDVVEATLDERSRSVGVRVVLQNADRRLKPGMFAAARIFGAQEHTGEVVAIPLGAVQDVDGHTSVFVREAEGDFVLRRLHLGERTTDQVYVLGGVEPGEQIVVDGSAILKGHLLRSSLGEEEG